MSLKDKIGSMMARSYTFNHLELNDIEPKNLRVMLIECFRRLTFLEDRFYKKGFTDEMESK